MTKQGMQGHLESPSPWLALLHWGNVFIFSRAWGLEDRAPGEPELLADSRHPSPPRWEHLPTAGPPDTKLPGRQMSTARHAAATTCRACVLGGGGASRSPG